VLPSTVVVTGAATRRAVFCGDGVFLRRWGFDDLPHGVVEAQAKDAGEQVDGVAGHVVIGPSPVAVLEDETGAVGQFEVAASTVDEAQAATTEDGFERGEASVADLLADPARFSGVSGHRSSLSATP